MSKFLGINWKLHTPYEPQASGQVEKMNHLIKLQLSKICQETFLRWDQALPLALPRVRTKPRTKEKVKPYEIMYGRPFQTRYKGETLQQVGEGGINQYLKSLVTTSQQINKLVISSHSTGLDGLVHPFQPGDWIYIKNVSGALLEEKWWIGPFQVLLTTYTAVKAEKQVAWIHYSRIKKAPEPWTVEKTGPLTVRITRKLTC